MQFLTDPFKHQLDEWTRSKDLDYRGILWEQGTGKTKLTIDTAWSMFLNQEIDGLLVLAPNGVHDNWVTDELPEHMPRPYQAYSYHSKTAASKREQRELARLMRWEGLAVLAMSYDAFMTKRGRKAALEFLEERSVLWVCDESQRIKTPSAKRTRAVVLHAKKVKRKRILSGTPVTNSPFDVYSQLRFLDEDIWRREGFASYEAFKTYFGVWEERVNESTGGRFRVVVQYKNLDQLAAIVDKYCSRVTKDILNLPPRLYSKRYFDLEPDQRRIYDEIKHNMLTMLEDGELVTTPLVIVQLLRLQQITCGYLPSDDCVHYHTFPKNPRLSCAFDMLEDVPGQAIIFARFHQDVDQIMERFRASARSDRQIEAVQYDGRTEPHDRVAARQKFQGGEYKYFVGNPACAGVGLTLHAASEVLYYSNSFNLEHRIQSEARAHRIGQDKSVKYTDIMARNTVDPKIVKSLRDKFNIASKITGDEVRKWL
jgi:SNF2 family DNA or RNA helicase